MEKEKFQMASPAIVEADYSPEDKENICRDIFERLSAIDISEVTEKKQGLTYLPWAPAERILLTEFPDFTSHIYWFKHADDWHPCFRDETGYMVKVGLTIRGVHRAEMLPVWEGRPPKSIEQPSSMDINTAIKRCGVKAAARRGLGLNLYAGEDLPPDKVETASREQQRESITVEQIKLIEQQADAERIDKYLQTKSYMSLADLSFLEAQGIIHKLGGE